MAKRILKEHRINRNWCKGCGICVRFCPKKVLEMDEHEKAYAADASKCACCQACAIRCPDLSIEIVAEETGGRE